MSYIIFCLKIVWPVFVTSVLNIFLVEDEVQEHLEKAKAEKVIDEVVRGAFF